MPSVTLAKIIFQNAYFSGVNHTKVVHQHDFQLPYLKNIILWVPNKGMQFIGLWCYEVALRFTHPAFLPDVQSSHALDFFSGDGWGIGPGQESWAGHWRSTSWCGDHDPEDWGQCPSKEFQPQVRGFHEHIPYCWFITNLLPCYPHIHSVPFSTYLSQGVFCFFWNVCPNWFFVLFSSPPPRSKTPPSEASLSKELVIPLLGQLLFQTLFPGSQYSLSTTTFAHLIFHTLALVDSSISCRYQNFLSHSLTA